MISVDLSGLRDTKGQLPKEYDQFDNDLLENLLRIFSSDELRTASGDTFSRIYEYFLMKFAIQGAQDNGEFFTPPSLVQTIVNVIEHHSRVWERPRLVEYFSCNPRSASLRHTWRA